MTQPALASKRPRRGATDLGSLAEEIRLAASRAVNESERSERGQYFTPWSVASLMAQMSAITRREVRLLDAGAGSGILSAAWLARACSMKRPPRHVSVVAYENDKALLPFLTQTREACREACERAGIDLAWTTLDDDFIHAGAAAIRGISSREMERFDLAILNPPYGKIRSTSDYRAILRSVGIETSNLYSAFVSIATPLVAMGGELITITPRSFCNGPYFKPYRTSLLKAFDLKRVHVFERRDEAFSGDGVLQENVIVRAMRSWRHGATIVMSSSSGAVNSKVAKRSVAYDRVVRPSDPQSFIHIPLSDRDHAASSLVRELPSTLDELRLSVSTGRVVDFRARTLILAKAERATVPLIYPRHFEKGFIAWPRPHAKKGDAIKDSDEARGLLVKSGYYVLVKRFSAKEETRRVVAAVFDPAHVPGKAVGFENHTNYFHDDGQPLSRQIALGLCAYLNSTLLDTYFRQFSGHTQVNATDLRNLHYPSREALGRLGHACESGFPPQVLLDTLVTDVLQSEVRQTESAPF